MITETPSNPSSKFVRPGTPLTDARLANWCADRRGLEEHGDNPPTWAMLEDMIAHARRMESHRAILETALRAIFAQTSKHSRQWGQFDGAMAFASDPDTATAFANARNTLLTINQLGKP